MCLDSLHEVERGWKLLTFYLAVKDVDFRKQKPRRNMENSNKIVIRKYFHVIPKIWAYIYIQEELHLSSQYEARWNLWKP